jgi:hypothetical protein
MQIPAQYRSPLRCMCTSGYLSSPRNLVTRAPGNRSWVLATGCEPSIFCVFAYTRKTNRVAFAETRSLRASEATK